MGQALDTARRFFERFEAGDMDAADDVFADDCKFVMPMGPLDKAAHRGLGESFKAAFPDAGMRVSHAVESATGDEVFLEGRFVGTHKGDLVSPDGTLPATGNSIDFPFADYFKVAGGKVVEHRTYWDQATMMGQLGAAP